MMSKEKLSVILVDDESLAREHVRRSVNWEELGLEIIGESSDGIEALDTVRRIRPAIAIVDINIPNLDGIMLSEMIRAEHPECKIIILSGYNEFDYAKKALRAGVLEYMLKPLRADELESALLNARNSFVTDLKQRRYINSLENRVNESPNQANNGHFVAMITGSIESPEVKLPGLNADSIIMVIRIDGCEDRWPVIAEQNRWHKAVLGVYHEIESSGDSPAILGPDGIPVMIFPSKISALSTIEKMRTVIHTRFGFSVSAGISRPVNVLSSLRASYKEALEALRDRFFYSIEYTGIAPVMARHHKVLLSNKSDIVLPLRMGNLDAIIQTVESNTKVIKDEFLDHESVELLVMEMMAAASQFLAELDIDLDPLLDENGRTWRQVAKSRETLTDLEEWLIHAFQVVLDRARDDVRFKTYRVVDQAIDFIRENYADHDLTLRVIADAVSINPTYLSKVFKLQSGFSVIEFLRETRLQESRNILIRSPRSMVFEVAETVGFSDPLYFSKVFKLRFGVSPRKFRR